MPTLTAKQRMQTLVAAFGSREGLRRLLALDGVVTAPSPLPGSQPKPMGEPALQLPAWITAERAEAIVSHFLHGELLLPWHVAAFWQDQWVAEGWPMVGAATVPSWQGAGVGPPSAGYAAWQAAPVSAAAAIEVAAQGGAASLPAALPSVPPQLWAALAQLHGDAVWLWTKYRKYFLPVAGQPPLLAGVLLGHEVAQGTLQLTLQQADGAAPQPKTAVVEVDCFAYTLAVAIGVLESHDFATVHNVMPKGYPSQWQAPEPAETQWRSPLHGDARFWHEFDEPPVGDRGRFVRQGLTRQEAVRVWARRVAVCLWGDANGHWGRWPWRLAHLTRVEARMLLAWDPNDWRATAQTAFEWPKTSYPNWTLEAPVLHDHTSSGSVTDTSLVCPFGQAFWPIPVQESRLPASWLPSGIWDTNPYLPWQVAWLSTCQPSPGNPLEIATAHVMAILAHQGFSHGAGYLSPDKFARGQLFRVVSSVGGLVLRMGELLNFNQGGCHVNAALVLSLLRSMAAPAMLAALEFPREVVATTPAPHLPDASLPLTFPGAGNAVTALEGTLEAPGHKGVIVGMAGVSVVTPHSDWLLAWDGGRYVDARLQWIPLGEWILWRAAWGMAAELASEVWLTRLSQVAKSSISRPNQWMTLELDKELDDHFGPRSSTLPLFCMPRRIWDHVLRNQTMGEWVSACVQLLVAHPELASLSAQDLSSSPGAETARWLAARFLGGDRGYTQMQLGVFQSQFPGYLRGAFKLSNMKICGHRGMLPKNVRVSGLYLHDDPQVVLEILRIGWVLGESIYVDET